MTDQTQPSWDDAPEWAQWLARDSGGSWYWHEKKPMWIDMFGVYGSLSRKQYAGGGSVGPGPIRHRPNK